MERLRPKKSQNAENERSHRVSLVWWKASSPRSQASSPGSLRHACCISEVHSDPQCPHQTRAGADGGHDVPSLAPLLTPVCSLTIPPLPLPVVTLHAGSRDPCDTESYLVTHLLQNAPDHPCPALTCKEHRCPQDQLTLSGAPPTPSRYPGTWPGLRSCRGTHSGAPPCAELRFLKGKQWCGLRRTEPKDRPPKAFPPW